MAGFSNDSSLKEIVYADNVDFSGATVPTATVTSAGQLLIGTGTSPAIAVSTLTAGTGISITNGPGTITLSTSASLTDLHVAKLIVNSSPNSGGNFTTITSALLNAISGDTIFVMPGSTGVYTEDITLIAGVNICAFDCDAFTPNVTIKGKITANYSGTVTISGIRLQTNSDFFLVVSGSNPTSLYLNHCYLHCLNNNGISYTAGSGSVLSCFYCYGFISTSGIALYSVAVGSAIPTISFLWCRIDNASSSVISNVNNGQVNFMYSYMFFGISTSGSGTYSCTDSFFDTTTSGNGITLTTVGTGTSQCIGCSFSSGTSSSISVGTGTTVLLCNNNVSSTNTNAITGLGTVKFGNIDFYNTSSTINTSTKTSLVSQIGSLNLNTPLTYGNGGTGAALTASNGGILYSNASTAAILAGTATAGQILQSGASTTPSWSTATYPATAGTSGNVITSDGTNFVSSAPTGGGVTWTDATSATQALLVQHGYITDRSAGVVYTLPASAALGDEIIIVGKLGLTTITPNANQQILVGSASGTVGVTGTAVGTNVGDCITLNVITSGASTVWRATSFVGNFTIN